GPVVLRRPHPFPTRRSSDLMRHALREISTIQNVATTRRIEAIALGIGRPDHEIDKAITVDIARNVHGSPGAVAAPLAIDGKAALDRKSTRLNSSHVKISYAV